MAIHQILARLTDTCIPLPPIACLLYAKRRAAAFCRQMASNLAMAWGLMSAGQHLTIWAGWGLDCSPHKAVALALAICLSCAGKKPAGLWGTSLRIYAVLMIILNYHGLAHILTTALASGFPMLSAAAPYQ